MAWTSDITQLTDLAHPHHRAWMSEPYRLAEALKCAGDGTLQVELLYQGPSTYQGDEASVLQDEGQHTCYVRVAILKSADGTRYVHARTVLPMVTYQRYQEQFDALDSRLLGDTLLYPHKTKRSDFEYSKQQLLPYETALGARRSLFFLDDQYPLLLHETFLPDVPVFQSAPKKVAALHKKAIVVHSGGMDSSLCLAVAIREFGADHVLSLSFSYEQRHSLELERAQKICDDWQVDHIVLSIDCLSQITHNALTDSTLAIEHQAGEAPNTLVSGRNGLMARLAAIHAESLGAQCIYMGVIEVEEANSGYRDCSRDYMDRMQEILRIDFANPNFEIRTPLVYMTKQETMQLGDELGVLAYLLEQTVTCYEGIPQLGCQRCPACLLRNEGIREFHELRPEVALPYEVPMV